MSEYEAPLRDMRFVRKRLVGLPSLGQLPGYEAFSAELAAAVLEEASTLASGVLSPLNRKGDRVPPRWRDGNVTTSPGWSEAYATFIDGGLNGLSSAPEYGGQGLPRVVSMMTSETCDGANVAFALCPMLTLDAIDALEQRASDVPKSVCLSKLVSGEWTGTMSLAELQTGSDLSAIRTHALPQPDGSHRLHGQKIFIIYGEHDLVANVVHLVLARTQDAPPGVKGVSLFVAPKCLPDADGRPGGRNDLVCGSIEHKLGIHGSPTCTMDFGRGEGAVAYLVGEENRALEYMFVMTNSVRFNVGLQGLGLAQRALQVAITKAPPVSRRRTWWIARSYGMEAPLQGRW